MLFRQLQGFLLSNESSYRHKKTPLCYTCCSPQTQERHRDAKSLYYKRQTFTIDSRRLIERWKKEGKPNREIASLLGKAPQTIHTEIKRGTVLQYVGKGRFKEAYSADYAQQSYESAGIKKSSHITQGNRYIKQALTISGLIAAHSNTLQKSNSNHVSFVLPYSSTACGSLPSLLFDFH